MGGFTDGTKLLSLEDVEDLVRTKEIEYPIATREEIQDKSKGDAVTKALVVLQTTWFLLQCAARGSQHLALTELELATAAFALLNIAIYALWWDKPLDVQCHIVVHRRSARHGAREASPEQNPDPEGRQPLEESGVASRQEWDYWLGARSSSLAWLGDVWDGLRREFRDVWVAWRSECRGLWARDLWVGLRSEFREVRVGLRIRNAFRGWGWTDVRDGLSSVVQPFFEMMDGSNDDVDETFFVVGTRERWDVPSVSGMILVTMVFGGIHCVAWSFHFPSPTEQLLWRISSIAITGVPLAFIGIKFIYDQLHPTKTGTILEITLLLLLFLYPVSRVVLLVLCLSTLRSLPPSAYQTVQWTTFLPHV